jgi:hypothetical protein
MMKKFPRVSITDDFYRKVRRTELQSILMFNSISLFVWRPFVDDINFDSSNFKVLTCRRELIHHALIGSILYFDK